MTCQPEEFRPIYILYGVLVVLGFPMLLGLMIRVTDIFFPSDDRGNG